MLMASRSEISHADALALVDDTDSISRLGAAARTLNDPGSDTSVIERLFGNIREIPFAESRAILQAEGLDTSLRGFVARSTRASWAEASTLLTDDRLGWPVREMLVSALPEIPLSEALPLLENNAIKTSVRCYIAGRIQHMNLGHTQVRKLLSSHTMDEDILVSAVKRVSLLTLEQVAMFIREQKARYVVEHALLGRIMSFKFSKESADFLTDPTVTERLRERAAMELEEVTLGEIADFLADPEVSLAPKKWVLWSLRKVSFAEALPLLRNESVPAHIRSILLSKLGRLSFSEARDFIVDHAVNPDVREDLVKTNIREVSIEEVAGILRDHTISRSLRIELARRVSNAKFKDLMRMIADDDMDPMVRDWLKFNHPGAGIAGTVVGKVRALTDKMKHAA